MPTERQLISSGSPYEPVIGFSRAVRVGDTVYVSGTVGRDDDGQPVGEGDSFTQAKQAIRNLEKALVTAGTSIKDVVRTRVYLAPSASFDDVARAHGAAFKEIRPASTFVTVAALADEWMLVEIEAVAVV
jgi:enamine deaminase RidA (YjgF/YER057c/UK114 family)